MRLLIVEDDRRSADYLVRGLAESGHVVDRVADGPTGLVMAGEGIYDVVIVDRRLPGLDGISLVTQLRRGGATTPVLMVSALGGTADRVAGIQAGCDDYLAKPYAFAELLARVDALGRRGDASRRLHTLTVADLSLDTRSRAARRGARELRLQYREFLLLELLMRRSGQVVSRGMLLEAAWDYDFEPRGNIIDMHLHRLRRKVDQAEEAPLIHTVAGAGYCLQAGPLRS